MSNGATPSRTGGSAVAVPAPARPAGTTNDYLDALLVRERIPVGPGGPLAPVNRLLAPEVRAWAGRSLFAMAPSGSYVKGTANHSGTDVDLLVSIAADASPSIRDIYESLFDWLDTGGFMPTRQTVAINVVIDGYAIDFVPAKQQHGSGDDQILYRQRAGVGVRTNVRRHLHHVSAAGCASEIRIVKLWRDQQQLPFPSLCLEMAVIAALGGAPGGLADNVWRVFRYLHERFERARLVDPANDANLLTDDVSAAERRELALALGRTLGASSWTEIVE